MAPSSSRGVANQRGVQARSSTRHQRQQDRSSAASARASAACASDAPHPGREHNQNARRVRAADVVRCTGSDTSSCSTKRAREMRATCSTSAPRDVVGERRAAPPSRDACYENDCETSFDRYRSADGCSAASCPVFGLTDQTTRQIVQTDRHARHAHPASGWVRRGVGRGTPRAPRCAWIASRAYSSEPRSATRSACHAKG